MSSRNRVLAIFYALVAIVGAGIIGYMRIEGYTFLEALYMTVITLSTVGFQEVRELTDAGRIFSVVLIVVGVGAMLYTLTTVVQYLLEGHLANIWGRRRMKDRIAKLNNHVILCGYGLVGREVARVFNSEGVAFTVVEQDPAVLATALENDYACIEGNATSDGVLEEAGIDRARALVAALGTDADNVYVTLSARELRSDLFIVARAAMAESEPKLRRAGANRTMSPYRVGGRRLAMLTLRPVVVDFVDTTLSSRSGELTLENVRLSPGSPVCGKTVEQSREYSGEATILAVRKADGVLIANPAADVVLNVQDELVVIGTREQLHRLEGAL
jgi:voltage-gated potassium channel